MSARREIIASGLYIGGIMSILYLMGDDRYKVHAHSREPHYITRRYGVYRYFHMPAANSNVGPDVTYHGLRHMEVSIVLPRPQDLPDERAYVPDVVTVRI